jgi:epoxyqueuosine reductase
MDATRCISYLTIELKSAIPEERRTSMGRHVYGCDVCQDVCPWNAAAPASDAPEWQPRSGMDGPRLAGLWRRSDEELQRLIRGSPMTRPRLTGLRRNIAVASGNSRDAEVRAALEEDGTGDSSPSRNDPMVREHVGWALKGR